jgi:hypothetical protein
LRNTALRFIIVFTRVRHFSFSWAMRFQSTPSYIISMSGSYIEESLDPPPKPQAEGQYLVGRTLLLIQHILCYPPYLEAVSSIRNLRTYHVSFEKGATLCNNAHNLYSSQNTVKRGYNEHWYNEFLAIASKLQLHISIT